MPTPASPHSYLQQAVITYVSIPVVLFIFFWLAVPFNFIFGIGSLVCLFYSFRAPAVSSFVATPWRLIVFLSLFFALIAGIGGFAPQTLDYLKHNFISEQLITGSLPPHYDFSDGSHTDLVYYYAYYLPPALLAKVFGSVLEPYFSFAWGALGLFLGLCLFQKFFRLRWWAVLLFFGFAGWDIIGWTLMPPTDLHQTLDYEWWSNFFLYPSFFYSLKWAPQHALSALLFAPLVWGALRGRQLDRAVALLALCLLWSPFIALGLIPFFFILRQGWGRPHNLLRSLGSVIFIAIPIVVFFSMRLFPERPVFFLSNSIYTPFTILKYYLAFIFLEFIIWCFLVPRSLRRTLFFRLTFITLLLCPLLRLGVYNDFAMRVSAPALLALAGLVLMRPRRSRLWVVAFCGVFLVGFMGQPMLDISQFVHPLEVYRPIRDPYFIERMNPVSRQYLGSNMRTPLSSALFSHTNPPTRHFDQTWLEFNLGKYWNNTYFSPRNPAAPIDQFWCAPQSLLSVYNISRIGYDATVSFTAHTSSGTPIPLVVATTNGKHSFSLTQSPTTFSFPLRIATACNFIAFVAPPVSAYPFYVTGVHVHIIPGSDFPLEGAAITLPLGDTYGPF